MSDQLQVQARQQLFNKVAAVTIFFWIAKVMATTVGETGADFLIFKLKFGLANTSYLMSAILVAVLAAQIRSRRYLPWLYWSAVVLVSIVGTLITDSLVDNFGVRLETTTLVFTLALIAAFGVWYSREKTLSVKSITSVRRELFYWLAILLTFALGTAAGDLLAERWQVGYLISGLIFAGLIGLVVLGYYFFRLSEVTAFWIAYVLSRPLGASAGDLLTQPVASGGLGLGTNLVSFAFLAIIVGLVAFTSLGRKLPAL